MRRFSKYIVLLFLLNAFYNYGQISPGDLTNAHAEFEGMSNCTLCHDLGNKVSNNLCLDCHKDIQALIKQDRGYHVSADVNNKDCFQCHNEHHGRKFEMIRFDEEKFEHDLTGYKLEGKHAETDCKKCHTSDFIADKDIKKRPNTFIGLETKCITCHDDYHQETLSSNDCASCHDTKKFSPAINFDHDKADFKLIGKHETVDCKKCHEVVKKNGKDFQNFNDLSFKDCKSCHNTPHNENIKGSCKQCHTETKPFKSFNIKQNFNHNLTNFTLNGKHKDVDCFSCHAKNHDPKLVFQDRIGIDEVSCVQCHDDKHKGKLGTDCVSCHNETGFISSKTLENFDHKLTDFPLKGMHQKVDCAKCHTSGKFTDAIDFSACKNCHDDYHQGEFKKDNISPDCKTCHSLNNGFDNTLFTSEEHQKLEFPLEGAHAATPCFACHISEKEERWTFKDIGSNCVDCHQDLHKDVIDAKYYPEKKCETCHANETWADVSFDHKLTNWPLEGKHLEVDCRSCHIKDNTVENPFNQKFANLNNDCSTCHLDNHNNQFADNGVTDCKKCHVFDSWIPEKFDHNTTDFRLEGRHAEIECSACHIAATDTKRTNYNYKIIKHQCIDCHR